MPPDVRATNVLRLAAATMNVDGVSAAEPGRLAWNESESESLNTLVNLITSMFPATEGWDSVATRRRSERAISWAENTGSRCNGFVSGVR